MVANTTGGMFSRTSAEPTNSAYLLLVVVSYLGISCRTLYRTEGELNMHDISGWALTQLAFLSLRTRTQTPSTHAATLVDQSRNLVNPTPTKKTRQPIDSKSIKLLT